MCDDCSACPSIVTAPVVAMAPVITMIVTRADADAEIFGLCSSCGVDGDKTQYGGSDCNVFHAYPPNASCGRQNGLARFQFHDLILQSAEATQSDRKR
jgi:hypothetical protein